ncbi:MAG: methylamine utilization protein, partial [Elusimicrobiota bacterium]
VSSSAIRLSLLMLAASAAGAVPIEVSVGDLEGKPLKDAVVFAYEVKGSTFASPEAPAIMDQVNLEFEPRLLAVQAGTKVQFPNKDNVHHHLYSLSSAKAFELPLYKGEPSAPVLFEKPGVVKLGCNIHDWMSALILVLPNPYFARTDAAGKALLEVPDASLELAVFHERQRDPLDSTRKKPSVEKEGTRASWKLALKPERKKKRPAAAYP